MEKEFKGRRTGLDFSKHELIVIENEHVTIHHLKKPNTIAHSVKFINVAGSLVVKGDFGNWMFCREFVPSATSELVSSGYWCEKAEMSSTQNPYEFDPVGTGTEIDEKEKEYSNDPELLEYLSECRSRLDENEAIHSAYAYQNYPYGYDHEIVPFCKKTHTYLQVVFDAFECCCAILTEQSLLTPSIK